MSDDPRRSAIHGLMTLLEGVRHGISQPEAAVEVVVDRIIEAARAPESAYSRTLGQQVAIEDRPKEPNI